MLLVGSPFFYLLIVVVIGHFLFGRRYVSRVLYKVVLLNLILLLLFVALADSVAALVSSGQRYNSFRIASDFYHHDLLPNQDVTAFWAGFDSGEYHLFTNSLGFVDSRVRTVPMKASQPRVLFMGDSFTEGVGYSWHNTFVGRISDYLTSRGVEVLNAGVVSYSPKIHYLKLKKLLKDKLQFDSLVLMIDVSDAQDEILYAPFVASDERRIARWYYPVHLFFLKHSFLYHALLHKPHGHDDTHLWKDEDELFFAKSQWVVDPAMFDLWGKKGLHSADGYVDKIIKICRQRNIAFSMVIYPWPIELARRLPHSRNREHWKTFAAKRNVRLVDMYPLFFSLGARYPQYFIPGDVHWNAKGHKLVADYIIQQLFSKGENHEQ